MALAVHATGTVSRAPRHAQLACFANPAWQAVSRSASDLTGGSCDAKIGRQTLALFGFVTVRFHYGRKETYNHVVKCVFFFFLQTCVRCCTCGGSKASRVQVPVWPEFKWIRTGMQARDNDNEFVDFDSMVGYNDTGLSVLDRESGNGNP